MPSTNDEIRLNSLIEELKNIFSKNETNFKNYLDYTIKNNRFEDSQLLIEFDYKICWECFYCIFDKNIHNQYLLYCSVLLENLNFIIKILENYTIDDNPYKFNPIYIACFLGNYEITEYLI